MCCCLMQHISAGMHQKHQHHATTVNCTSLNAGCVVLTSRWWPGCPDRPSARACNWLGSRDRALHTQHAPLVHKLLRGTGAVLSQRYMICAASCATPTRSPAWFEGQQGLTVDWHQPKATEHIITFKHMNIRCWDGQAQMQLMRQHGITERVRRAHAPRIALINNSAISQCLCNQ